jgi:hypothetical protein
MYGQRKLRNQWFYTDTIFGKCKSLTNNTCTQIFANEAYFVKAYPMEKKSGAGLALRQFIRDCRVPEYLTSDGASEQTGPKTEFIKNVRKYGIVHHVSKTKQHRQNRAESASYSRSQEAMVPTNDEASGSEAFMGLRNCVGV